MGTIKYISKTITENAESTKWSATDGNIDFNATKELMLQSADKVKYDRYEPVENKVCNCKVHAKAKNFKELVALVKDAEDMLIQNELTDVGERINTLRGIYYGSLWSVDYTNEKSTSRNLAFTVYTGSNVKYDARIKLKCSISCKGNLFQALYISAEVYDTPYKALDFGHLIIGLDSRRSWAARHAKILTQGGTGLELNTWVGDLGGGAGFLSNLRAGNSKRRAKSIFPVSGSSYGAMVNLEGDIGAYVAGMDEKQPDKIVDSTAHFTTIHEVLQDYFINKWNNRAFYFMAMLGGKINNNEIKYEKETLVLDCADKIEDFAKWYLGNRMRDKNSGGLSDFGAASKHFKPVAEEVSSIFIEALIHTVKKPSDMITARTDPNPKAPEETTISKIYRGGHDLYEKLKEKLPKY
ncbi:hypothetical protein [Pedobacter jeongneungensis]|uniref:hypothetical protein n=1 Tax=Pedobacter jeongneungensis TaxID=947309 RepID=UPI000467EED1|nr:hypothetical protein [Pedobacter jeongneungensis]